MIWLKNIEIYPVPDGEGMWELYIRTDHSDNPMGDRYIMGGKPPAGIYAFKTYALAEEACLEWKTYLEGQRLTGKKVKK